MVVLERTYDQQEAENIRALLEQNGISQKLSSARNDLEATYGMQGEGMYEILVAKEDIEKAKEIIARLVEVEDIPFDEKDYTDSELEEIVLNPNEWNEVFIKQAKKALGSRGKSVSTEAVESNEGLKLEEEQKGIEPKTWAVGLFFVFAFMGGLIGLVGGLLYYFSKTKASDGNKYYSYTRDTRTKGVWLIFISIASLALQIYLFRGR